MKEFIRTEKINLLESEIEKLEKELINQKNLLRKELQNEFNKQFELVPGKTILLCNGVEYIYKSFDHRYLSSFWIEVFSLKKDGTISKNIRTFSRNSWTKTGKEYNDCASNRIKL